MIMAVISPLPLAVEDKDYTLAGVVSTGKDRGKNAYINTRFVRENHRILFSGEDYNNSLKLMQNELSTTDNLRETLSCWFDETGILTLSIEEVSEFNGLYKLTKDPGLLNILVTEEYEENLTMAEKILLDSLDVLISMSRRETGGKVSGR